MLSRYALFVAQDMKKQASKREQWLQRGHGNYLDIHSEKEFFATMKGEERMVCHFYRESFPCKVVDKHLNILSKRHIETKFCKVRLTTWKMYYLHRLEDIISSETETAISLADCTLADCQLSHFYSFLSTTVFCLHANAARPTLSWIYGSFTTRNQSRKDMLHRWGKPTKRIRALCS